MSKQSDLVNITQGDADINGGTIDGTVIGGSTPAAISGTTGQFDTSLNVDGTITSDGLTVGTAVYPTSGPLSNRNKIINGAMVIDQRNAGAAVTPAATEYTLDRYRLFVGAASKLTVQQVTDAPAGFTHSTKITVASSYTPASSEQFFYGTSFEAVNVGDLGFGTAAAQTTTLSFWVKSSVTGTYSFSWTNHANNRSYVDTFVISSANTWEKKTSTIAGDTTGTWPNTGNGRHSFLQIGLGAGSNFDGTAGVWQAGNLRQTSGSVDFVAQSNGATFYLTGVQLEAGDTATPFEHRSYGQELALCQRYFEQSQATFYGPSGSNNYFPVTFLVNKRTAPSVSIVGLGSITGGTAGTTVPIVDSGGGMFYMVNIGIVGGAWTASAEL